MKKKAIGGEVSPHTISGEVNPHTIIQPEEKECTCEKGNHVVTWSGWFTDDIEGHRIYCTSCNSIWNHI